jgi:hypothetical protein
MRLVPVKLGTLLVVSFMAASLAWALPVELKDQNQTNYRINTQVSPLITSSQASGAVLDATYNQPVTLTTYFVGLTPFGFFFTTYTAQRQINVPLTNAFLGFNGLILTGANGVPLPAKRPYNPGQVLAGQECQQNNKNRELVFQPQTFNDINLMVQRRVFVPDNASFVRWINMVTNIGPTQQMVGITLQGLLGSGPQTKVTATSSGDSVVAPDDLWFTTAQSVPQGTHSTEPAIGYVLQGDGATAPARAAQINSLGQAIATYTPTIPAGGSVVVMTFVTVQGNKKQVKNTVQNLVSNPLPSNAIKCMSQQELKEVVNFKPITPPVTKTSTTITLNFKKTAADTVAWKGKITLGSGTSLQGLPVTVDVGGAIGRFVLNKNGKANNGNGNKFSLNANLKNGKTTSGTVNFSFNLKGDFKTLLADDGLTDANVKNVPVTVPIVFTAGPGEFAADQPFKYKAKQGKSGTATAS